MARNNDKHDKHSKKIGSSNVTWGAKQSGNPGSWWTETKSGHGGRTSVVRDEPGRGHVYGHFTENQAGKEKDVTGGFNAGQESVSNWPSWAQDAQKLADTLFDNKPEKPEK